MFTRGSLVEEMGSLGTEILRGRSGGFCKYTYHSFQPTKNRTCLWVNGSSVLQRSYTPSLYPSHPLNACV